VALHDAYEWVGHIRTHLDGEIEPRTAELILSSDRREVHDACLSASPATNVSSRCPNCCIAVGSSRRACWAGAGSCARKAWCNRRRCLWAVPTPRRSSRTVLQQHRRIGHPLPRHFLHVTPNQLCHKLPWNSDSLYREYWNSSAVNIGAVLPW